MKGILRSIATSLAAGVVGVLVAAAPAQAVTLFLNNSNDLADGPAYVQVDITGSGTTWNFVFDALTPPFSPVANFGIQSVGFNVPIAPASISVPSGWSIGSGNQDGFGSFEVVLSGTGSNRQDPLSFVVTFAAAQGAGWWEELSSGGNQSWLAAHVAAFDSTICPSGCNSAFFATSDGGFPPTGLPEPGAHLLLLTAFGLLAAFMRRRARAIVR